jgi:NAD(P)-dependent dehydrogenase (short-subunit alcohol dehydrogenase family)
MPTTLILGASRGIGLEFARQYSEGGARVIATARDEAGLARLKALGVQTLKLDVTDPASISSLGSQLAGEPIDVALYVAGVFPTRSAATAPSQQEFDQTMHTNVLGAMQAIPQIAPLVEKSAAGKFAFITSAMARIDGVASSYGWTYRVSKAALNMAVAAAQNDYRKAIMVAMSPGWVKTDMGGEGATLTAVQSVSSMRRALAALTAKHKGKYIDYDGSPIATW